MSGLFNDPDTCEFRVFVIWPDGQTTRYEGMKLEAAGVAAKLRGIADEIAAAVEEARTDPALIQSSAGSQA